MKKFISAIIALAAFSCFVFAGGETAADVLKTPVSARSLAVGNSGAALDIKSGAALINPALIGNISNRQLFYMHSFGAFGIRTDTVSYAQNIDLNFMTGGTGASFIYRHMDAIDNPDATEGPVDVYDYVLAASAGFGLKQYFPGTFAELMNAGISVKLVQQAIGEYSATSVCGDIGLLLDLKDAGFKAALAVLNAGMPMKFISEAFPLPLTVNSAFSWSFQADNENFMTAALAVSYDIYDYPRISAGIEDRILNVFFVRAGYDQPLDTRSPSYASVGAGLSVTQFGVTVELDYTYRPEIWGNLNAITSAHFIQAMIAL